MFHELPCAGEIYDRGLCVFLSSGAFCVCVRNGFLALSKIHKRCRFYDTTDFRDCNSGERLRKSCDIRKANVKHDDGDKVSLCGHSSHKGGSKRHNDCHCGDTICCRSNNKEYR